MAETAAACNRLMDADADRFAKTAAGQFHPLEVKRSIEFLKKRGFDIGWKSAAAVRADCAKIDKALGVARLSNAERAAASKRSGQTRRHLNDVQRLERMGRVHAFMERGDVTPVACEKAGVCYSTYMGWRVRYAVVAPPVSLQGSRKQRGAS